MHTQEEPHSSIQVEPNTRPSLRDGRTAYAVLSREPSSFWPPSPSRNSPASAPVDARCRLRKSLTVATTARTTRFCRTHGPPFRRSISSPVDEAGNFPARRDLAAPFVRARPRALRGLPSLPAPFAPDAAASTASRLAIKTTTRSPLKDEPGWAGCTIFPKFGKGEYFCGEGLTEVETG